MPAYESDENDVEENIDIENGKTNSDAKQAAPDKLVKSSKGGWKEAKSQDDKRLNPKNLSDEKNNSDDDIPYIPQLDEGRQEDSIAMAPQVAVHRVATYKELEIVLKEHAPFATLGGNIDLKLLMLRLLPEESVLETDEEWTWENLFIDVKSELMAGKESNPNLDIKLTNI